MARTVLTASNGVPVYKNLHTADCWEGMVFGGDCVLMPEQRDTVQSAQDRRRKASDLRLASSASSSTFG